MTTSQTAIVTGLPMMKTATPVESVEASSLTPARFRRFVMKNRPCLVKGGAAHWPALRRWSEAGYLCARTGPQTVNAYPHVNYQTLERHSAGRENVPFAEAWRRATAPGDNVVAIAWPISNAAVFPTPDCVYENLRGDLPGFPFLPDPPAPLFYPRWRGFIYKSAGTGWHYHHTDCTLMTQVKGRKLVGLLPPDSRTFEAVAKPLLSDAYFDDPACLDGAADRLSPLVGTVEEGDAMFIPPYWWHGVEAGEGFGITVAFCWRPPLHVVGDLSVPAAREIARTAMKHWRNPLYAKLLGFAAAGAVANAARRATGRA